jgi:acetyl-CoA carboxylase biotin carboxyl carrier protein
VSDLSYGEVGEILHLLQEIDGAEVQLEWGDLKIQVRRGLSTGDAPTVADQGARVPTGDHENVSPEPPAGSVSADRPRPVPQEQPQATEAEPEQTVPDHWIAITAPMAGTFYRAPKPDEPPFVEVGDTVTPGDTVALIEVMKLYTELKAEAAGKIARVEAVEAALVEFGQPLVWIEPA